MISTRTIILTAVVFALFALPCMADAPSFEFKLPVGVRSYGMGETGTADTTEVTNVAYNPAIVSMLTGVRFGGGYLRYKWSTVRGDTRGGFVGGGYRWKISDSYSVGAGAAAGHVWRRYGLKPSIYWPGDPPRDDEDIDWLNPKGAWYFSAGAMVGYRGVVSAGIGLSVKPYRFTQETSYFMPGGVCGPNSKTSANPVDAGIIIMATPYNRGGYRLTASAGYTYFHLAGDMKTEGSSCIGNTTIDNDQFAFRRYGVSVAFALPTWEHSYRHFQTELPKATVSVNYDYEDPVDRADDRKISGFGTEISIIQTLFFRVGFVKEKAPRTLYGPCMINRICATGVTTDTETNPTWGVGVGLNKRRIHARLDYGRASEGGQTGSVYSRFGLTVKVDR